MSRKHWLAIAMRILVVLALGVVVLEIWKFSLETSSISAARSGQWLAWMNQWVRRLDLDIHPTEQHVRKLAHFSEFALLGFMLQLVFLVFSRLNLSTALNGLFIGLLGAVTDETLQMFTDGRNSSVTDILIDFGGVLAGSILFWMILAFCRLILRLIRGHSHS